MQEKLSCCNTPEVCLQDAAAALERCHAGVLACQGELGWHSPGYPSAASPPRGTGGGPAGIVTPLMLRALVQNCQVRSLCSNLHTFVIKLDLVLAPCFISQVYTIAALVLRAARVRFGQLALM